MTLAVGGMLNKHTDQTEQRDHYIGVCSNISIPPGHDKGEKPK